MNKLTKVGCSALCGSLAAMVSANAGTLTVTGGADMTWMSKGNTSTTGNPIGIGSNMTFNGGGELDNGWTFDLDIALANGGAYSSTVINLDMGGFRIESQLSQWLQSPQASVQQIISKIETHLRNQ